MTALIVIVILVLLIVVHECGHFIAAKLFGVRVDEFGIGYPPRAFSFGIWGGTEYTLNWLPFGGFVRLFGDEGIEQHGRGSLLDAARWKQAVILISGVIMNAIFAWVLFAAGLHLGVLQEVQTPPSGEPTKLIVSDVVQGSPAQAAGLKPGDEITSISDTNGETIIDPMTPEAMVAFVSARGGKPLTLSYLHNDEAKTVTIIPANAVVSGAEGRAALGIALALVAIHSEPWLSAMREAFFQTTSAFALVGSNLWALIDSAFHGAPNVSDIVGPVGIVSYVGEASQQGFGSVLLLAGLISINLTVVNLIPVPALDGGRLLVLVVESAMRRRAPRFLIQLFNLIGGTLIILLMVVVTYHDIHNLLV